MNKRKIIFTIFIVILLINSISAQIESQLGCVCNDKEALRPSKEFPLQFTQLTEFNSPPTPIVVTNGLCREIKILPSKHTQYLDIYTFIGFGEHVKVFLDKNCNNEITAFSNKFIKSYLLPKKEYPYNIYLKIVYEDNDDFMYFFDLRDYDLPMKMNYNYFTVLEDKSIDSERGDWLSLKKSHYFNKHSGLWKVLKVDKINGEPFNDVVLIWSPIDDTELILENHIYDLKVEAVFEEYRECSLKCV